MVKAKQQRRKVASGRPLAQVAALPYRMSPEGQIEILVMSSRETQRAVIPKGWPMKNRKDWKSAQIEAKQEAGVIGDISRKACGRYRYWKRLENHFALTRVTVYPLLVKRQLAEWPERHERSQMWLTPEDAALLMDETELGVLILNCVQSLKERGLKPPPPSRPTPASSSTVS
jgi:hypothetical protein